MTKREALDQIRDEIVKLHKDPNAVLADFFAVVNVDEEGRLMVDGYSISDPSEKVALRF